MTDETTSSPSVSSAPEIILEEVEKVTVTDDETESKTSPQDTSVPEEPSSVTEPDTKTEAPKASTESPAAVSSSTDLPTLPDEDILTTRLDDKTDGSQSTDEDLPVTESATESGIAASVVTTISVETDEDESFATTPSSAESERPFEDQTVISSSHETDVDETVDELATKTTSASSIISSTTSASIDSTVDITTADPVEKETDDDVISAATEAPKDEIAPLDVSSTTEDDSPTEIDFETRTGPTDSGPAYTTVVPETMGMIDEKVTFTVPDMGITDLTSEPLGNEDDVESGTTVRIIEDASVAPVTDSDLSPIEPEIETGVPSIGTGGDTETFEVTEAVTEAQPEDSKTDVLATTEIPGEGDCQVNGTTYLHGDDVPSFSSCKTCTCKNSVVKCLMEPCPTPPPSFLRCESIQEPDNCCPTYQCRK